MRVLPALITIAMRRAQPGTGSSAAFLQRRTAMLAVPDLSFLSIPWVLVEGLAIRAYAPERMTQDVDILIAAHDEGAARAAFQAASYRLVGTLSIGGFTVDSGDEASIDVILGTADWVAAALRQPGRDIAGYPVIPRPYLILMKLESGRSVDMGDLSRLLGSATSAERREIRTIVGRYRPDLLEDYDALVVLADLEFGSSE